MRYVLYAILFYLLFIIVRYVLRIIIKTSGRTNQQVKSQDKPGKSKIDRSQIEDAEFEELKDKTS